jgi:hypothetical protein
MAAIWCEGLVRGAVEAVSAGVSGLDPRALCAELGFCNATTAASAAAFSLHA